MENKILNQFTSKCLIIKNYEDLVKVLEMDLELIENPNIKETVKTFQELVGNIDELPELMHNILIYNSTISFATNYDTLLTNLNSCELLKYKTTKFISYINEAINDETYDITKGLKGFSKLKQVFFKNNIKEVTESKVIVELKDKLKLNQETLSINEAKIQHLSKLILESITNFVSQYNPELQPRMLMDIKKLKHSLKLNPLEDSTPFNMVDLSLLKTIVSTQPHDRLNITTETRDYLPDFMCDSVDNYPSLVDKMKLIKTKQQYEAKINEHLNKINEYFVHRLDLSYLDEDKNYEVLTSGEKVYKINRETILKNISTNIELIKNNKIELIQGCAIYAGCYAVMTASADLNHFNPSVINLLTASSTLTLAVESILNFKTLKSLVGFAKDVSCVSMAAKAMQNFNDTLDGNNVYKVTEQPEPILPIINISETPLGLQEKIEIERAI